jgi:hypothetical protein
MVFGDIGGAKIMLSARKELMARGISVRVIVDADPVAKGGTVWEKAGIPFEKMLPGMAEFEDAIREADLIFAGSCATAFAAEYWAIERGKAFNKFTVIGSDMWFNHAQKQWRNATPDFWLAIDEIHQKDILKLRPDWLPDRVPILGQPAFDNLPALIANKENIRRELRAKLGIANCEHALLYWSPGENRGRCTEGFIGLIEGIQSVSRLSSRSVIIPRIHPKMKQVIGEEYDRTWREIIATTCKETGCRLVWANDADPQKLNLASDVVLSQWSTDSITSAICGVPTVNIFLSEFQDFLLNDLHQERPFLPTVKCGAAVGVFSLFNIGTALCSLDTVTLAQNAKKMMPSGHSAEQIAAFLKSLL